MLISSMTGVLKHNTVPVPATPILETPQIFPYLCQTLALSDLLSPAWHILKFIIKTVIYVRVQPLCLVISFYHLTTINPGHV